MKLAALVIAMSLTAAGGAFAQSGGPGQHSTDMQQQQAATTASQTGDATARPNVFKRIGNSVKNGFHKLGHKNDTASGTSTQSMGAAPAADTTTTADSARQARIDAAYANYKNMPQK